MAVLLARGQITIAAIKDGKDGAQGKPGKDGITWTLTPDILTYDTDDSGKAINVGTGKATTLRVLRGNEELTNFTIKDVKNMVNCVASRLNNTSSFYISAITVQKVTLGTDTMDVSCTNGSFDVEFAVDGVTYTATAKFAVNVSAFTGRMTLNNKQFETNITSLQNTMQGKFETLDSKITQTAKDITLSVSQKRAGRRNLLYGTAFRQDGLINCEPRFQPTMTEGVNGMNAVRFSVTASDSYQYHGLFWRGKYGNIPVKRHTDYTFSCWVKCDNPHALLLMERYSKADATTDKRGNVILLSKGEAYCRNDGNWQLVTNTFNSGDTDFVEVNIFLYNADDNGKPTIAANACFCMPMLEEGTEYTGWTPAETDYHYVGGNLLDDTMALTRSSDNSNLQFASGLIMFSKYEGCYGILYNKNNSAESQFTEALQYKFPTTATLSGQARIVKNQDYVFSFVAKGSGNINVYLYGDSVHANVFTETCEGKVYPVGWADGYTQLALTSTYKRYWVHWRIEDYTGEGAEVIPDKVLIRVPGDTEAWVTKPKLEEGAQLTDYTERKTDLIDKATAKAAGLEITADGVELYGDKVKVKNNGKTAAMFTDGKLNADLIDADTINVHHVWAKDGNNQNTLAHFGNYDIDEAKDEDGKQYPLWVGSSTAADSPFRVSKDGYMYADKGAFGVRYYEDEDSGTRKKFGRFEITGEGLSSGAVFKEDSMKLTDTRFQLIKAEGRSAIFIDTDQTLAVPGPGTYLSAKMRVDAIDTTDGYHSNVCYFAEAKNGVQNYALRGTGDVSVNGGVYGYKYTMINMTAKNVFLDNTGSLRGTAYNEVQKIDSLTLIVSSKKYLALALPTLGTIKHMLFGSQYVDDKFCVRLTVVMDIGSESIAMRGRCTTKDGAGVAQWNTKDLPLIIHWNGGYWSDFDMAAGDSYEFLLTYNPDKSYTLDGFTQPYLARIINRQY